MKKIKTKDGFIIKGHKATMIVEYLNPFFKLVKCITISKKDTGQILSVSSISKGRALMEVYNRDA